MYYKLSACTFTAGFFFLFWLSPWPRVEIRSRTHDVPHDTCSMSTLYQLSHELAQQVVDFIAWLEINNLLNIVITHYRTHERI